MCFQCGKQGHKQQQCWERNVFCTKCHNTEACRRYPNTENTQTPQGTGTAFNDDMYHPIATPAIINSQPEPQPQPMFNIPRQQKLSLVTVLWCAVLSGGI